MVNSTELFHQGIKVYIENSEYLNMLSSIYVRPSVNQRAKHEASYYFNFMYTWDCFSSTDAIADPYRVRWCADPYRVRWCY